MSAIGYLAGLGIFEIFMPPKGSALDYVSVSMVSLDRLFPTIVSNMYRYFIQIKNDFKIEWIFLVLVILLVFLFVCVRDSARNKPAAVFLGLLTLVLMFFYLLARIQLWKNHCLYPGECMGLLCFWLF